MDVTTSSALVGRISKRTVSRHSGHGTVTQSGGQPGRTTRTRSSATSRPSWALQTASGVAIRFRELIIVLSTRHKLLRRFLRHERRSDLVWT